MNYRRKFRGKETGWRLFGCFSVNLTIRPIGCHVAVLIARSAVKVTWLHAVREAVYVFACTAQALVESRTI